MGNETRHHSVDITQYDFFIISHVQITRVNLFKLVVPNSTVDACANYFSVRIFKVGYGIGYISMTKPGELI